MVFLIKAIQFLAGLSIIIGIHELGHLLFAKLFKMRVNSYIIGFPPKIFKIKFAETEYALGLIPLGGAVQIAGMVEESLLDSNNGVSSPQSWEFRSKQAWQRLVVILGGIIFNLVSSMIIYIALIYLRGYTYLPKDEVNKYGIMPNKIGIQMGFKEGDKIIRINGKAFEDFNDILSPRHVLRNNAYYTINRGGIELDLPIPKKIIENLANTQKSTFIKPIYPCTISAVIPNSSAHLAGLIAGDQIIALAGRPTLDIDQLIKLTEIYLGQEVEMSYLRNGIKITGLIKIEQHERKLGIKLIQAIYKQQDYSLMHAIPVGIKKTMTVMHCQLLGMWQLITGKLDIKKSLSGPIGIAQSFENEFIWYKFWPLIASLSIVIALTNLLPIPLLDGGHALFILYEMISGRKVSDSVLQITQKFGMMLLFLLTIYVFGNDIRKLLA